MTIMKRLNLMALAVASLLSVATFANDNFKVDTKATKVKWLGEKVTGEHAGNISLKDGTIDMKDGKLVSVSITMDMNSITCTDIEDAEYNAKLVGHLKNEDFFNVSNHQTSNFKSSSVKLIDAEKGKYKVSGEMTIKGITKTQDFEVTLSQNGDKITASAKIIIDRTKYDIRYGSASFFDSLGDKAIYDNFTLTVSLEAIKSK